MCSSLVYMKGLEKGCCVLLQELKMLQDASDIFWIQVRRLTALANGLTGKYTRDQTTDSCFDSPDLTELIWPSIFLVIVSLYPSSAGDMNEWSYASTPMYAFVACTWIRLLAPLWVFWLWFRNTCYEFIIRLVSIFCSLQEGHMHLLTPFDLVLLELFIVLVHRVFHSVEHLEVICSVGNAIKINFCESSFATRSNDAGWKYVILWT
jgi:hypothetical protein